MGPEIDTAAMTRPEGPRTGAETEAMLQFAATHGIEAVVEVMPLARVNDAIERVRTRAVEMALVLES